MIALVELIKVLLLAVAYGVEKAAAWGWRMICSYPRYPRKPH